MSELEEAKAKLAYFGIDLNFDGYTGEHRAILRVINAADAEITRLKEELAGCKEYIELTAEADKPDL